MLQENVIQHQNHIYVAWENTIKTSKVNYIFNCGFVAKVCPNARWIPSESCRELMKLVKFCTCGIVFLNFLINAINKLSVLCF